MNKEQANILRLLKHDDQSFVIQGLELATAIASTPLSLQKLLNLPQNLTPRSLFRHFESFLHAGFITIWILDFLEKHGIKLERHYQIMGSEKIVDFKIKKISKDAFDFWSKQHPSDLQDHVFSAPEDEWESPIPKYAFISKDGIFLQEEKTSYIEEEDHIYITEYLPPDKLPLYTHYQGDFENLKKKFQPNFSFTSIERIAEPVLENPADQHFLYSEYERHFELEFCFSIFGKIDLSQLHLTTTFHPIVGQILTSLKYEGSEKGTIDILPFFKKQDTGFLFSGCFVTRQNQLYRIKDCQPTK